MTLILGNKSARSRATPLAQPEILLAAGLVMVVLLSPLQAGLFGWGRLLLPLALAALAMLYGLALRSTQRPLPIPPRAFALPAMVLAPLVIFTLLQVPLLSLAPGIALAPVADWLTCALLFVLVAQAVSGTDATTPALRVGFAISVVMVLASAGFDMLLERDLSPISPAPGLVIGLVLLLDRRRLYPEHKLPLDLIIGVIVLLAACSLPGSWGDIPVIVLAAGVLLPVSAVAAPTRRSRIQVTIGLLCLALALAWTLLGPFMPADPDHARQLAAHWGHIARHPILGHGTMEEAATMPAVIRLWLERGMIAGTVPLLLVALLAARSGRLLLWSRAHHAAALAGIGAAAVLFCRAQQPFSLATQPEALLLTGMLAVAFAGGRGQPGR